MTRPAPDLLRFPTADQPHPLERLSAQERAVFDVLAANPGRVVSRHELARQVGLTERSERRCDSLIVGVRRAIGTDRVRTVRRRGWMLEP